MSLIKSAQMEEGREVKNIKKRGRPFKKVKTEELEGEQTQKKLIKDASSDSSFSQDHDSSSSSSEIIEPALKTMKYRSTRGTKMKDLMKGKNKKDKFWEQYEKYFGGDINKADNSEDEEDYQASSSGKDQFDSDFDLTDSYVGKRGRKKGTKLRKRGRGRGRGRATDIISDDVAEGEKIVKKRGRKCSIKKNIVKQSEQEFQNKVEIKQGEKKEVDSEIAKREDKEYDQKDNQVKQESKIDNGIQVILAQNEIQRDFQNLQDFANLLN